MSSEASSPRLTTNQICTAKRISACSEERNFIETNIWRRLGLLRVWSFGALDYGGRTTALFSPSRLSCCCFWLCTGRPPFPRPTCRKFYFSCCDYNRIADLKASHRTEYLVKRQPKNRVPRKTTATEQDRIGQKAPLGTKNLNSFLHSCQQDIKSISLLLLILHLLNKTNRFIILIRTTTTRSSKLW